MNLSAPFIPQFFKAQVDQMIPFCDIVIGNESEAAAYAESHGLSVSSSRSFPSFSLSHLVLADPHACLPPDPACQATDPASVATAIANLPKQNASRPRLVIITQGASSTLVASSSVSNYPGNLHAGEENPKTFPVKKMADDEIVDTNGAGDAFAGGFLGAFVQGKTLTESVEAGHALGQICVGQVREPSLLPLVAPLSRSFLH